MGDEPAPQDEDEDALQRELRNANPFSLEEAIGRLAGPGGMKGASPASRLRQAQAAVDDIVRRHLRDPEGALTRVLVREVAEGRPLLDRLDSPAAGLAEHLRGFLAAPALLAELVREADTAWGATLGERPHFEGDAPAPHPDDPYTRAGVRRVLEELLAAVEGGGVLGPTHPDAAQNGSDPGSLSR